MPIRRRFQNTFHTITGILSKAKALSCLLAPFRRVFRVKTTMTTLLTPTRISPIALKSPNKEYSLQPKPVVLANSKISPSQQVEELEVEIPGMEKSETEEPEDEAALPKEWKRPIIIKGTIGGAVTRDILVDSGAIGGNFISAFNTSLHVLSFTSM